MGVPRMHGAAEVGTDGSSFFALGLRVAAVTVHAGDRSAAIGAITSTLQHELQLPVVAWDLDGSHGRPRPIISAGLTWRRRARLHEIGELRGPVGSRAVHLRRVAKTTRALLVVPRVTVIDADPVAFVIGGDVPGLTCAGPLIADVVGAIPDPGAGAGGSVDRDTERRALDRLTGREQEVLNLLAAGLGTAEIATKLGISPMTVKTHVQNILAKLGVRNRLEAALVVMHQGSAASPSR